MVENRAGAGGAIGAAQVAQAPPDGHTLMVTSSSFATSAVSQRTPWDALASFDAVAVLARAPFFVMVNPDLPARNLADLARLALVVAGDVTEERHYWPGNDDPTVLRLRQGGGFARVEEADTALAAVVGACDGELSIAAITAAVASLLHVEEAAVLDSVLPRVRELVATGMLRLP